MAALFSSLKQQKEPAPTRNYRIRLFGAFVLLSLLFWGVTKLSNTYTTTVQTSLVIEGVPQSIVLTQNQALNATMTLSASGFRLIWYRIFPPELIVYVDASLFDPLQNNVLVELTPQQESLEVQLREGVEIKAIRPLQLPINYAILTQKNVAVLAQNPTLFEKGYGLTLPVQIVPDSLTVFGAAPVLDTLDAVYFEYNSSRPITEDFEATATLIPPQNVRLSRSDIVYRGQVSRFTEKSFEVPLSKSALADSLTVKLFPDNVRVVFSVPLDRANEIQPQGFVFAVDFTNINPLVSEQLEVQLVNQPEGIKNLRWEPQKIQYLIRK